MTSSYNVRIKKSAEKELRGLPKKNLKQVFSRIHALATNPRPVGCEKSSGSDWYRVRQGDYRIVYIIDDDELLVEVVKIGHRKEVYRVSRKQ